MASPGNQHCANCIGTLSFPMWRCGGVRSLVSVHVFYTHQYAVNVGCGRMIRGSHHRCSCLPPLAARPGADRFQGRCADVQSFTWKCAAVSGTIRCCCQSARPTDITLWWHQSSDCAIRQTFNSRWPGVLCCWTSCLEHSAGGDNDIAVTPYFPSTAKNPGSSGNHIRTSLSEPEFIQLYN